MKPTRLLNISALIVVLAAAPLYGQAPAGTAFTYQGQLQKAGLPLSDTADFQFTLWDALTEGNPISSMISVSGRSIANGLFTVTLDFGASAFTGDARFLEIVVRSPAGSGSYTTLSPRQELTPVPYASYSLTADALELPFDGTASYSDNVFKIANTGSGGAGQFVVNNSGGLGVAVYGQTNGGGAAIKGVTFGPAWAGFFEDYRTDSTSPAVEVIQRGLGRAGYFHIENSTNGSPSLEVKTTGLGRAAYFNIENSSNGSPSLEVKTTGLGRAGYFNIENSTNGSSSLEVKTTGLGRAAYFHTENVSTQNHALFAEANGLYCAGWFKCTNTNNNWFAVAGENQGTTGYAGGFIGNKGVRIMLNSADQTGIKCDGRIGIALGTVDEPIQALELGDGCTAKFRSMGSGTGTDVVIDSDNCLRKKSSSQRYKENIRPLQADTSAVVQLKPVRYTWKQSGEPDIGLIAEDVETVLPDLIVCDQEGRPDAVKYDRLSVYLIEVIKAQGEQIAALQSRLESLEARIGESHQEQRGGER